MIKQPISVIIPAAGESQRFHPRGREKRVSKIYSELNGEPMISRVIRVLSSVAQVRELVIAVEPGSEVVFRRKILNPLKSKKLIKVVSGGRSRAESVWNGLKRVSKECSYVCIHDAARPLVKGEWVTHLARRMNGCDGLVMGRRVIPTVKLLRASGAGDDIDRTLDRSSLFEAETPQLIKKELLLKAYRTLGAGAFRATDDSSLVEAIGCRIKAVIQPDSNVKVTTFQDLTAARRLASCEPTYCFGLGFYRHRLVPHRPFYLGGVRIQSRLGPLGHSDGDPLLHAITDGVLGAIGAGDIGDFFPDTDRKWERARSVRFLKKALELALKKGFRPAQVDATIFLERPKLGKTKRTVQFHLSQVLSLPIDKVSVKAKTLEGFGPEGSGIAVSCQALVVLKPSE